MAKTSGGVRTYKPGTATYTKREREVEELRASGKYSSVTMSEGGGYVAVEKSPKQHKPEEVEVARILARKGYKVKLKDEAGMVTTEDGKIFEASFEQRSPTHDRPQSIRNALFHARDKSAKIAVIYSRKHIFSRKSVEEGIKLFEAGSRHRFERIIIVADNGHVHRYKHNTKRRRR